MLISFLLFLFVVIEEVKGRICYACDDENPLIYGPCYSPRQLVCQTLEQSCASSTSIPGNVMKKVRY